MRLSDAFDLNVEVRASVFDGKYLHEAKSVRDTRASKLATALVGFSYKFNEREFKRCNEEPLRDELAVLLATATRLQAAQDKLAQENTALQNKLKRVEAENQKLQQAAVVPAQEDDTRVVFFMLNSSSLSANNKNNLKKWAAEIKAGDPHQRYIITGYCDQSTGTVKRNLALSEERAQQIYHVLTHEFGVNPNQLKVDFKGGITDILLKSIRFIDDISQDPAWDDELLQFNPQRVAIIEEK
jgi:outer membrane protein OmpA-like peptidoglycan-associated protein